MVKLQGFHSAFGEDAQIYTHEELLEQFELFEEGLPDDEDKRLHYLRYIREFKENNPKEFKRIKAFPLKARTARIGDEMRNGTVTFLKSPYKTEFYQVNDETKVSALTFLEAAQIFEAQATETPYDLPPKHFQQVQAALDSFDEDFLGSSTEKITTTDKADAHTKQALKFLRDFKGITHQKAVKEICQNLQPIVESGIYTPLPNELKKINQKFFSKREVKEILFS